MENYTVILKTEASRVTKGLLQPRWDANGRLKYDVHPDSFNVDNTTKLTIGWRAFNTYRMRAQTFTALCDTVYCIQYKD